MGSIPVGKVQVVAGAMLRTLRAVRQAWVSEASLPVSPEPAAAEQTIVPRDGPPWPDGHYYSPVPSLEEVRRGSARAFPIPHNLPGIDLRVEHQLALLREFEKLYADQPFMMDESPDRRYYFENQWFSYGDALILHCMLRHFTPKRLIEVGSGFSSAVILDTIDQFLDERPMCTFIEPYPDRLRSLLRGDDAATLEILERPLQDVDLGLFGNLGAGDILFVDSTHVSKVGSDVNWLFFEILPRLAKGVIVHIHDIFYPFEYPKQWLDEGRAWNEDYLLRAFLTFNDEFRIVFFNSYLGHLHLETLTEAMPLWARNPGGSIWLERCADTS